MATAVGGFAQTEPSGLHGMAIVPVMYRTAGRVGSTLALPIEVQNLEMRPLKVTLKINPVAYSDWTYAPNLGTVSKFDCSSWFATKSFAATVDKTSNLRFPLKCTIPHVDPGVYYCLGTIDPTIVGDNSVIIAEYQIPIIIFVGPQPKLDLKFGTPVLEVGEKASSISVPFMNEGDAFTVIGAAVQLRDAATGRSVAIRTEQDRNLYPQTKRNLRFSLPKIPDGQYQLQCTCQSGTRTFRPLTASYVVNKGKAELATPGTVISLPPFTVDPGRIHQAMPAGSQRLVSVKLTNQTDNPLTINFSAHKLTQINSGLLQVLDEAPAAGLTVDLTPGTITIPARHSSNIRIKLSLDPGSVGDSWFAISAISAAGDSMSEEIYGNASVPETGTPKLEIVQKETGKVGDIPISIDYEVTNTGNMALLPKTNASVLEGGLTPVARLEIPLLGDGGILPGATLRNRVMLPPNLKPGAYTVKLEYQYGETLTEVKQFPFVVPNPSKKKVTPAKSGKPGGNP